MTVLYFCPDFPSPSGGTRTLYQHVRHLNDSGIDACIVHHRSGFKLSWHELSVPVRWLGNRFTCHHEDILVFPEGLVELMKTFRATSHTKIVIALSWSYIYPALAEGEHWRQFGIQDVLTPCRRIQSFVRWTMNLPATLFYHAIDRHRYQPAEAKENLVVYSARKSDAGTNLEKISRYHPILQQLSWQAVDELPESDYARILSKARFFLACGIQEGLNVSVLEAMASGCIVMGFNGGGSDYMTDANALLVENGDYFGLGLRLEEACRRLSQDPTAFDALIHRARQTAEAYMDRDRERKSITAFFAERLYERSLSTATDKL